MRAHGTVAKYNLDKCRCEECKAARSAYTKRLRRMHKSRAIPPKVKHGTTNCYRYYGCRCECCRMANSIHGREWRAKQSR